MYTMEDFKAGKISVWADTKSEAERFVAAFKKAGLDWMCGAPRLENNMSFLYGWKWYKGVGYASSKDYAAKNTNDGKPYKPVTVAEFFAPAYPRDQLFIFRTADGIIAVQKQDGKEVKRATVKRYHKDADDFLTGAAAALDKLRGEQKPTEYKVGDVVKVCASDMKKMARLVGFHKLPPRKEFVGAIKSLNERWGTERAYGVYEENGSGWRTVLPEDVVCLVRRA